jgi:hypothetical protein
MHSWNTMKDRLKKAFNPDLNFESKWVVSVSDTHVSCTRPNGVVESVSWDDLKMVAIETTDEGPYVGDVFWYLAGEKGGCVVPLGAIGEDLMVERLQALSHFNHEAFAEAMTSTSNRRFLCWQRSGAT